MIRIIFQLLGVYFVRTDRHGEVKDKTEVVKFLTKSLPQGEDLVVLAQPGQVTISTRARDKQAAREQVARQNDATILYLAMKVVGGSTELFDKYLWVHHVGDDPIEGRITAVHSLKTISLVFGEHTMLLQDLFCEGSIFILANDPLEAEKILSARQAALSLRSFVPAAKRQRSVHCDISNWEIGKKPDD